MINTTQPINQSINSPRLTPSPFPNTRASHRDRLVLFILEVLCTACSAWRHQSGRHTLWSQSSSCCSIIYVTLLSQHHLSCDVKGSEVINCYIIVHFGGDVGRIASGIPPFVLHFRAECMLLGTKNVVH